MATKAKPQFKAAKPAIKIGTVIALLEQAGGATLAEIARTTGWQPHSARAALTELRKKGHTIEESKRGDQTCYRITGGA